MGHPEGEVVVVAAAAAAVEAEEAEENRCRGEVGEVKEKETFFPL